ncbi:SDR family NAD(P)-dependent oxidoreductase [Nocardioides sp. YIM 152315]|uniref:SDR family NAD(P)-dependent oxidoreductase n=1 Tax=Nocardioides sp. YIM 152315 TaxID=3031760 RepID=UPI0023D99379|nr:SDR family NAD(P)-dependent oxidoreductase [Nocardioides sp. YIM 152315]MDF1602247.1 SDR family NAD(P)-dependent oxidoreductase [Nocardioides sp. YIM 152315]
MGICENRVVVVTGAGAGIGREHALEFARQGARVVVNDVADPAPVVKEIEELGGEAVASTHDVGDWDQARQLVHTALEAFGNVHTIVNNAGILRDKMLVNMTVEQWDAVIRVHLRGTFCVTRHAVDHWRAMQKAGTPVAEPRIVNTSSPSGLFGNVGQCNYGAAKAAIASFTVIAADELSRLDVCVNAIAPTALTDMTAGLDAYVAHVRAEEERTGFDAGSPANIAPLVAYLGSGECVGITGRVFTVKGGEIAVAETWVKGPARAKIGRWEVAEIGGMLPELVASARPNTRIDGTPRS